MNSKYENSHLSFIVQWSLKFCRFYSLMDVWIIHDECFNTISVRSISGEMKNTNNKSFIISSIGWWMKIRIVWEFCIICNVPRFNFHSLFIIFQAITEMEFKQSIIKILILHERYIIYSSIVDSWGQKKKFFLLPLFPMRPYKNP